MEAKIFTGKTVDEALTNATIELETTSGNIEYEVLDKGSVGILGLGSKPAKISVRKKQTADVKAEEFLSKIFNAMGLTVKTEINIDGEEMLINLSGDDMGLLIGKRGQTLDSLQYLLSLVVNRETDEYIKIKLDTENYRERRKETLESLAKNIAFKVTRTRHPVSLEPMNPYERRIIHSALQNNKFVTTRSEGDEPYRHIVVLLKK